MPVPTDPSQAFTGIDGLSAKDFWAVGDSSGYPHQPTILHWDGSRWNLPPIDVREGGQEDVAVISESDAWAVGSSGNYAFTQALHWDGSRWSNVPIPSPFGNYNRLFGVSATGSSDVWAVGMTGYSHGLITHWDGARWSVVEFPDYPRGENFFDVLALTPDDAWVVGEQPGVLGHPVIQHWDGAAWTDVPFSGNHLDGGLFGLDGSGPDEVWAVGDDDRESAALVFHWDGIAWTRNSPASFVLNGQLVSVSDLTGDDVWVAGSRTVIGPPLAAHWDGSTWRVSPVEMENASFYTIKAFTHREIWAGGLSGGLGIKAERFLGCGDR